MQRKTILKAAAALTFGLGMSLLSQHADAHTVYGQWYSRGGGGGITDHYANNTHLLGTVWVGRLASGALSATTNGYSYSQGTFHINPTSRCSNGAQTTRGQQTVTALGQVRSAPTCESFGYGTLSQGQVGVSE